MAKNKSTNTVFYGKPSAQSFDEYKKFIRGMSEKLGIPKEKYATDEELRAAWKKLQAKEK